MFLLDHDALDQARRHLPEDSPAVERLRADARAALGQPLHSVLDKPVVPPSGDKHDYFSLGRYWWPNPETADGLPYVRRDGQTNPSTDQGDSVALGGFARGVETLTLAAFFEGNHGYAENAARRIRTWFLAPETRMNPHLNYAQAIPGICEGRGIGIIDTVTLRFLPDMAHLLAQMGALSSSEIEALQHWFAAYAQWLLTSENGLNEAGQHNNHGSWFDAQAALFSLFAAQSETAAAILSDVPERRFKPQIAPDGSLPFELARTRSYSYTHYNLGALADCAALAQRVGKDLWNWADEQGRSLRAVFEWCLPYGGGYDPEIWPHPQITPDGGERLRTQLRRAQRVYGADGLDPQRFAGHEDERWNLLYPVPASVRNSP